MARFQNNYTGMFLRRPSIKFLHPALIRKKHGHQGRCYFSLYVYMENFKNLLKINQWPDFKIISQECSLGDPLSDSFKKSGYMQNSGCHGNQKKKTLKIFLK